MKPKSCKQKGRNLQKWVRDTLLGLFSPTLQEGDVRSTSMGASGEDLLLSPLAQELFPYQVECKNHKSFSVYKYYEQAAQYGDYEPLVVIKADHKNPLIIVDAEHFLELTKIKNENRIQTRS